MKTRRFAVLLVLFAGLFAYLTPAWGVSKEIIELQTQVQQLQDQMTHMKQSFDERMVVMKNLLDQNTDSMNKTATAVANLQAFLAPTAR